MVTVYDVPPEKLILKTAEKLKGIDSIEPPEWSEFVKTGRHTEKSPTQDDWWYTRAASVLRKIYMKGPMGSSRLSEEYGGFADRGAELVILMDVIGQRLDLLVFDAAFILHDLLGGGRHHEGLLARELL